MAKEVPIAEKSLLTPEEAAAYFNIGVNKIRMMTDSPSSPATISTSVTVQAATAHTNGYLRARSVPERYSAVFGLIICTNAHIAVKPNGCGAKCEMVTDHRS